MKKQVLQASLAGCMLALSQGVWAESFILKDVRVSGLERVAAGTVLSNVPVRVGERFDDRMTANIVRSLYKTGLFDDVRISKQANVLLVKVHERAAVGDIEVSGNHVIESKALIAALKQAGVAEGRPLDQSALNRIQREIKQQYLSRGNYAASVNTQIVKLPRNRVLVKIKIHEGGVARIKGLRINGNRAYSDATLMKLLDSGTKGKFSFLSSRDKYAKEKLIGDIDKLTAFYRDRGFLNFEVVSTQVSLTKDKQSVYMNLNIHEGDQYRVGRIKVVGDSGLSQNELKRLLVLKEGQVFSQSALAKSRKNLQNRLGKDGYAFARIGILPQVDKVNKRVDLVFQPQKGQRTYVRRINIRGNFRTKDEVFRREMRQLESAFLSKEKVKQSKARIQRLQFVKSVRIRTSPVAGRSDQVDLNVLIVEQSSNRFNAAVGYSGSGVLFSVGLKQNNFMGTGKSLTVAATNSKSTKNFRISYNNPYHTVDGVGRGFNVYYNKIDASEADVSDYSSNTYGASVNYTIPVSEDNSIRFSIGGEHREIITSSNTPKHITDFVKENGSNYNNILGKVSYVHDTRDRFLFPTSGQYHNLSFEVGLPGSDLEYYKARYKGSTYLPVSKKVTFALKGGLGYGDSYGNTSELPFFERFYSGGISTVRGYENNSLGPKDSKGDPKGGTLSVNARAELLFPAPFAEDIDGLRLSAFVDAGNVYEDSFDAGELRYSAGLSATWISPVGPFTISYAKPIHSKDGDDEQKLQFSIGASF